MPTSSEIDALRLATADGFAAGFEAGFGFCNYAHNHRDGDQNRRQRRDECRVRRSLPVPSRLRELECQFEAKASELRAEFLAELAALRESEAA
jgi:hypothetical protein